MLPMCADIFWLFHCLVILAEAVVRDLGQSQSDADRIVESAQGVVHDASATAGGGSSSTYRNLAVSAYASGHSCFGPAARRVVLVSWPIHIIIALPLQLGFMVHLEDHYLSKLMFSHVLRLPLLLQYFRSVRFICCICMSLTFSTYLIIILHAHLSDNCQR